MQKRVLTAFIGMLIGISAWAQVSHFYTSPDGDYKLYYTVQSDGTAGITKWEVLDNSKAHFDIVIPETFTDVQGTWPVTRTIGNAFGSASDNDKITSVKFPESFKIIDRGSFSHCTGLTSLTLPSQLEEIGGMAFALCTNLRGDIIIPETVKTIGESAFWNCGFDGRLDLPDNLQDLGQRAFMGCANLSGGLVLPETLTELKDNVFSQCKNLTGNLVIPQSVKKIGTATFASCAGFTGDLILHDAITSIGTSAFHSCTGLEGKLHLPAGLKSIGAYAFAYNHFNGELILPEGLETISSLAFFASGKISGNITLPASLKTLGDQAFRASANIESFTAAPGMKLASIGNSAFNVMPGLRFIDFSEATESIPAGTILSRKEASPFYGVYNDVLVYLPESVGEDGLVDGEENFIVGSHCANFVVYDEYHANNGYNTNYQKDVNYIIRHPFKADKASYKRLFSGKSCKTVFLPYPAKVPDTLAPYQLNKKGDNHGRDYLQFERIAGNTLEANTPYLLVVGDGFVEGTEFPVTNGPVDVPVTPAMQDVPGKLDSSVSFSGTTHSITNADAAALGAYNLNKNVWRPVTTRTKSGYVHRFRSFVKVSAAGSKEFSFGILLSENETTDIDAAATSNELKSGQSDIYSADGKYLGRDWEALESGCIYIVNGKKLYKI